jgi:endopeptidase La
MDFIDKSNKRTRDVLEFSTVNIIDDLKNDTIEKLQNFSPDIKGKESIKFLNKLKYDISIILSTFSNINDMNVNCLKIQLTLCIDILEKVLIQVKTNKNLSLSKCFDKINDNIKPDSKRNKKTTSSNNKNFLDYIKDEDDEYLDDKYFDDDSEYLPEDSDDDSEYLPGDSEDDSEYLFESDDDDDNIKYMLNDKKGKKNQNESLELDENYDDLDDDDDDIDDDDDDDVRPRRIPKKRNKYTSDFFQEMLKSSVNDSNGTLLEYFENMNKTDKLNSIKYMKEINSYQSNDKPLLFKILNMTTSLANKNHILKKYLGLVSSRGESSKLKSWIDSVMTIPFGLFTGTNIKTLNPSQIKLFLSNLQKTMDDAVWGHDEAKRHIIQIMGQQFRNPNAKGNMIGIHGPAGNGKTTLIKEGIAKAMNKPFIFISLGGATDSSFLEGHSFTYEGSICGRIASGIIESKCMDPIIYFDELDKISKTTKGDEIANILVHLTDPVQNNHFKDKYFHGIDFDLSKVTFIFSYNDPSTINPILMDRITQVETKFLLTAQKIHIAQKYLIPSILKDMGLDNNSIVIPNDTIKYMIETYTKEGGVRKIKELLYSVVRELNIANLTKMTFDNCNIIFPYNVTLSNVKTVLKQKYEITPEKIYKDDRCGVINGMYASGSGSYGGVMPIQVQWIPTSKPLEVKATGNLLQVIKESTQVATTLAFNHLTVEQQDEYLRKFRDAPKGFHLHMSDGATAKDGPSAGTALTVAIFSMLTNRKIRHDIAITGEIDLLGNVSAIGGLENKLEGAKSAGVKLALYPKENQKDIDKIKERNPTLIDENLSVFPIETIDEALYYSLV